MYKITNWLYEIWFNFFVRRHNPHENQMLHPERLKDLQKNLQSHFSLTDQPFCISFSSTGYWESLDYLQNQGWDIQLKAIDNDLYYVINISTYKIKRKSKFES